MKTETNNGSQHASDVSRAHESVSQGVLTPPYAEALKALVRQIEIGTFFDQHGHDAKMLKAYHDARAALAAHEAQEPVAWRYRYHPNGEWHLADESAKGSLAMTGAGDTFEVQPTEVTP